MPARRTLIGEALCKLRERRVADARCQCGVQCVCTGGPRGKLRRRRARRCQKGANPSGSCIPEPAQSEEGEIGSTSGLRLGARNEKTDASWRVNGPLLRHIRNPRPSACKSLSSSRMSVSIVAFEAPAAAAGMAQSQLDRSAVNIEHTTADMISKGRDASGCEKQLPSIALVPQNLSWETRRIVEPCDRKA